MCKEIWKNERKIKINDCEFDLIKLTNGKFYLDKFSNSEILINDKLEKSFNEIEKIIDEINDLILA